MKRFIPINSLLDKLKRRTFTTWIDKLTFFRIFLIWASIIGFFGLVYHFFTGNGSFLFYVPLNHTVKRASDSIYFSFITATSTGYGDIIPSGFFKFISIVEVVFGLLLLAFVTSKLISIKQDIILNEIYEISFNEKINRLRSSLLVFRQNLSRIINKIEENSIRKREISEIYVYISSFEDTLNEIHSIIDTSGQGGYFKKVIDPLNTELLFNSILTSFEKLNELISILNQSNLEWRRDLTLDLINRCMSLNDVLFSKLNTMKNISEKTISDINLRKSEVCKVIKGGLTPPTPIKKE